MTFICRAVRKATGFPIVGLCHGVKETEDYLIEFAGLEKKRVTSLAVGLNHLTFIYDFRYGGKDAWGRIREKLAEFRMKNNDLSNVGKFIFETGGEEGAMMQPFSWELFDAYNAFPAAKDRHVTEFFPERFPGGSYYGKTLGVNAYAFEFVIERGDKKYEEMARLASLPGPLPKEYFDRFEGEHEQLMDIIDSIEQDERKYYSVNLPNNGAIPNLPVNAVIELPAAATAKGLLPLRINDFPDTLAAIIAKHAAIAEIVVEAALKGDLGLLAEAIMMGGYISDRDAIRKMVEEMIKAHHQYLPEKIWNNVR